MWIHFVAEIDSQWRAVLLLWDSYSPQNKTKKKKSNFDLVSVVESMAIHWYIMLILFLQSFIFLFFKYPYSLYFSHRFCESFIQSPFGKWYPDWQLPLSDGQQSRCTNQFITLNLNNFLIVSFTLVQNICISVWQSVIEWRLTTYSFVLASIPNVSHA